MPSAAPDHPVETAVRGVLAPGPAGSSSRAGAVAGRRM